MGKGLLAKQSKFVAEFLRTHNATAAARAAGYRAPEVYSTQLLLKPKIQAVLKQTLEAYAAQPAEVVKLLTDALRGDVTRLVTRKGKPDIRAIKANGQIIKRLKFEHGQVSEIELLDKLEAARLLGKHFGLFIDKVEVGGPAGGPVQHTFEVIITKTAPPALPEPANGTNGNGQHIIEVEAIPGIA